MMDTWEDDFILPEIYNNIICLRNLDHHEHEGYTVSLEAGNYKNDFHAAHDRSFHPDNHNSGNYNLDNHNSDNHDSNNLEPLITSSVYTDINREHQNPNAHLIEILLGMVARNECQTNERAQATDDSVEGLGHRQGMPTISYRVHRQLPLISY